MMSTEANEGVAAQLAKAASNAKEVVNVRRLLPKLNDMLDSGRLQTALPNPGTLQRLYMAVETSKAALEGVTAVQRFLKWAGGLAWLRAVGGGYAAVKHLFD